MRKKKELKREIIIEDDKVGKGNTTKVKKEGERKEGERR